MNARLLVTGLFLSCAFSATAQLTGTFYLEKTTFAPGELIFLYFKVLNRGRREGILNRTGLPGQPVCAGYVIEISRETHSPLSSRNAHNDLFHTCVYNGPLSGHTIEPGKTFTEKILLNFGSELRVPGEYSIDAKYLNLFDGPDDNLKASTTLHLRIGAADANASPDLKERISHP